MKKYRSSIKGSIVLLSIILLILNIFVCNSNYISEDSSGTSKIITCVSGCHNGDAKFWNDKIITSVNGKLTFYGLDGNVFSVYDTVNANWIDVCPEENVIIYGNFNKEVGIAKFDNDYNLLANDIILKGNLSIDPTIIKRQDSFYITVTQIEGTVNNADPNVENGKYTVQLYKSDDLLNWTFISEPISCLNNIEDIDLFYTNDTFCLCYEKEQVDKGVSSICIIKSVDKEGVQWEVSKELLQADSDHEPATIVKMPDGGFRLYYSCDKDNIGSSYMGAKIYYAVIDENFNLLDKDISVITVTNEGILLYDVKQVEEENTERFLFAKNYLTECDMVVEELYFSGRN